MNEAVPSIQVFCLRFKTPESAFRFRPKIERGIGDTVPPVGIGSFIFGNQAKEILNRARLIQAAKPLVVASLLIISLPPVGKSQLSPISAAPARAQPTGSPAPVTKSLHPIPRSLAALESNPCCAPTRLMASSSQASLQRKTRIQGRYRRCAGLRSRLEAYQIARCERMG